MIHAPYTAQPLTLTALAPLTLNPEVDLAPALAFQETEGVPAQRPNANQKSGDEAPTGSGGLLGGFLPFLVIGAVFWFLIIGPERRNRKRRDQMLTELKKGDRVMTTGGLYGRIAELRDDTVVLDTGDVKLKFARSAIQGLSEVSGDDSKT